MLKRTNLHAYQLHALDFIRKKLKCGLFLDMGLGKTTTSLTAASDMLDDFQVCRVLVIAPLRVANTVWKQEASKWEHLQHLNIDICTGSAKDRLVKATSKADIHVINRENIPWLVENVKWRWDMVIVDESSSFKNMKSRRFKALKKVTKYFKSIILLTGTPSPNGLLDLWSQIYLVDNGERLGRTMSCYKQRYFEPTGYMGYNWAIKDGSDSVIKEKIADICMTMSANDYLELPDRIDIYEKVELPASARKQYKDLEKELIICLEDDTDIEALSAGALVNKLLQMCNGAVYDVEGNAHEIHDVKIKRLKEIVEENEGENFLVAYNFKSDLERLTKAFPEAVVLSKSGDELGEWNKGNIKMLLAHPASAGHGLNAQYGGSAIVWFGLTWSLELYQQFNARLHRQGQQKPVRIIHIVAQDRVDQQVLDALNSKASTQQELLNYLKANLDKGNKQ